MPLLEPKAIEANQARMESARSAHDSLWAEIATLAFPRQSQFFGGGLEAAGWNQWNTSAAVMHDAYTAQALEDGVSAFEGFVLPRGQRWQKLELGDEALMRKVPVRAWLEQVEMRLFALRNDPMSGFAGAVHESGMSLFAFGAQSMWVDKRRDLGTGRVIGLSYQSEFIGDIWIECDAQGYPMRIHRRFRLTAEAAWREWGDKCPPKVAEAANSAKAEDHTREFAFLHVIEPNMRMEPGRLDAKGKPWLAAYYGAEDKAVFMEGGSTSLPRIVSRFARSPNADWGYSPMMTVLPMVRQLQAITIDRTIAAEMALKPPILAMDDELDGPLLEVKPYGVTFGGLDERSEPVFKTWFDHGDATDAEKLTIDARALIDRVFYRDLLQINREMKSHVSAARVMEEVAEKGLLLSPLARQENEWLSRMTQRELALMEEMGLLDDMPGEIAEYFEDQGRLDIRYDNTLSHMQEAGKSVAFLNLAQQVGLLAQYDKGYVENFKREYPPSKVLPELGRIAGVPAAMQATEAERAAYDDDKAQAAQLEQLLAAAPAIGGAVRDLGNADQLALPAPA
jgi:hypothetical protein